MKSPESKNLPIGTGEKFQQERGKERLPAVEVANKVIWVNPAFEGQLPFKLKEGEETNLGMFFTTKSSKGRIHRPAIMPEYHKGRSGLIGSVIFQDQEGRLYRDVDVKGLGRFERTFLGAEVAPVVKDGEEALGLLGYPYAARDRKYSEKLLEAGIRTHRVVAFIDIHEIVDAATGMKTTIAEAKARGIIPENMEPILAVRAFGTKERVDYFGAGRKERRIQALRDAMAMVAQELGIRPEEFSEKEYLLWFAKTLGQELAKIRKLGLYHGYLFGHNITLDCRIVDLDSVAPVPELLLLEKDPKFTTEEKYFLSDYERARATLFSLAAHVDALASLEPLFRGGLRSELLNIFSEAYEEGLKIYDEELIKGR